jgi:hypothetical protein
LLERRSISDRRPGRRKGKIEVVHAEFKNIEKMAT